MKQTISIKTIINKYQMKKTNRYQLITAILAMKLKVKIIILTGHIDIENQLAKKGLPIFPIISKPITYEGIKKAFSKF